jgi:hypothetical protein
MQQHRTFAQIESTRNHTREYFELVCADIRYDEFTARLAPPPNLGADEMLDLIIWLEHRFDTHWKTQSIDQDDLDRLEAINRWPARLYPGESILSRPFATFLAEYDAGDDGKDNSRHAVGFHDGLLRLNGLQRRLRTKKLMERWFRSGSSVEHDGNHEVPEPTTNPSADPIGEPAILAATAEAIETAYTGGRDCHSGGNADLVLQWLKDLQSEWWRLDDRRRSSMKESFVIDPINLVAQAELFLSEGCVLPLGAQPFDGNQVQNRLLRPYAKDLQVLCRCLRELRRFAGFLGRPTDVMMPLLEFLEAEFETWNQIARELSDTENQELQPRVNRGQEIFDNLKYLEARGIGKIRPYLLFSYARDSGLL